MNTLSRVFVHSYRPVTLAALICAALMLSHDIFGGEIPRLKAAKGTSIAFPVQVVPGWNLLSLPLSVSQGERTVIFPTSVSEAFEYHGLYVQKDTLVNGRGFWLKFDTTASIDVVGEIVAAETLTIRPGWNLIGSLTLPVAAIAIISEPPGEILSDFFEFSPGVGYQPADTIQPGRGYWVLVAGHGQLIADFDQGSCLETIWYEGKAYNTVRVGPQCWMKENLDVGTFIPGSAAPHRDYDIEKYCYDNDPANCALYGGLYQWDEAMMYDRTAGGPGICPQGYHIPTYAEFQALDDAVSRDGDALKELGQGTGTNASGFSALLAGQWNSALGFRYFGSSAEFWSSTELDSEVARELYLAGSSYTIGVDVVSGKANGKSVRCIRQ